MTRYVSIGGVIVGGICDVVLTNIFVLPVILVAALPLMHAGQTSSAVVTAQLTAALSTPGFATVDLIIGAICSIIGGYIAASIAKKEELLNGILSSWLCSLFGIVGIFLAHDLFHRLLPLVDIPLAALLGGAGGYLRLRMLRSKSQRLARV